MRTGAVLSQFLRLFLRTLGKEKSCDCNLYHIFFAKYNGKSYFIYKIWLYEQKICKRICNKESTCGDYD